MIRIIDSRATGKTSRLMLLAKENNAILVCNNPRAMAYKAKQYGIDDIEFMSYGEYYTREKNPKDKFIIDELENYVMATSCQDIIAYSLSVDNKE